MEVSELRFRAMASQVHVIVVDGPPEACATAQRAIDQLESTWSRFIDSSDISRLNQSAGQPLQVDPATITLIETMREAWLMTDGRYDPTILRSLIRAGYVSSIDDSTRRTDLGAAPAEARPASFADIEFGPDRTVAMPPSIALDAGGIGKGLAADLVVAELLARGAAGALVDIGGDLVAAGDGPEVCGWRIAIEDALDPSRIFTEVLVSGGGVATSSTQTRRWVRDNAEHHHSIDPVTGDPSKTDLAAVTVVASCGWQAEAHATALLLGGASRFHNYAESRSLEALATTLAGTTIATGTFAEILPHAVTGS